MLRLVGKFIIDHWLRCLLEVIDGSFSGLPDTERSIDKDEQNV